MVLVSSMSSSPSADSNLMFHPIVSLGCRKYKISWDLFCVDGLPLTGSNAIQINCTAKQLVPYSNTLHHWYISPRFSLGLSIIPHPPPTIVIQPSSTLTSTPDPGSYETDIVLGNENRTTGVPPKLPSLHILAGGAGATL